MCLKKCNTPRLFRGGVVLLFVLTLPMLYISLYERSKNAEPRFHLKKVTSGVHGTSQRVKKQTAKDNFKDVLAASSRRACSASFLNADSTNQTSAQNNTAELSRAGFTAPQNESKMCLNSTEVQNMRQHILKFYNPETNLTLTQSSVRIGQRLKYEFGAESFNVTEDFLKLVPKESPLKDRHFKTCAVVGNSGIVLNSSCGQEIDSMDFVIRCNLPQIEGYEKDVGSKANFTTMNPSIVNHNFGQWNNKTKDDYDRLLRRLKQIGDQILYVPAFTTPVQEKNVRVITQVLLEHKLPISAAFPPARIQINRLVKSIWANAGFKIRTPSTGAHMYTLAAAICDQIYMYGFYPFSEDTRGRALSYHYYDTDKMISNSVHSMPEEFKALLQLHKRGALVLHTEQCN